MGRVRTKTVKKSSRQIVEKYYSIMTVDFQTNKKMVEEIARIPTKRLRNKIAGYSTVILENLQFQSYQVEVSNLYQDSSLRRDESKIRNNNFKTHLVKRIQRGPVRGISLKLQEEERERRLDFVPDVSAIQADNIEVDKETLEMLGTLGIHDLPGVVQQADPPIGRGGGGGGGFTYNRPGGYINYGRGGFQAAPRNAP